MKLFGTPGSPYVRKVRIALGEKRMAYEVPLIDRPSNPDSKVPLFNPLGRPQCSSVTTGARSTILQ